MDDAIHDALGRHGPYEPIQQLQSDDRNLVAEVAFEGTHAVCKVARDEPTGVDRDAAIHELLRRRAIVQVPTVLAASEGCLVTEHRGVSYDGGASLATRRARLRSVGATMARVHRATAFESVGDLRPTDDGLVLDADPSWRERFLAFTKQRRKLHDGGPFEHVADAVLDAVCEHAGIFADAGEAVLVHGDFEADNVRFQPDGTDVAAVVDWELARAEPGEFDLARAELGWFLKPSSPEAGSDLRGAIRDGYRTVRPLPPGSDARRRLYRAALTLGPLSYIDDVAERAGVPEEDLTDSTVTYIYDCLDDAEEVFA
ncbi:MAG: phosphotransferase family protein [Halolamina sp.]